MEGRILRRLRRTSRSTGIALVAASMLMLQAVLGAVALGTAHTAPLVDIFGNPLCITSATGPTDPHDERSAAALPDCCTSACSMFAPLMNDSRVAHSLPNPLAVPAPLDFAFDPIALRPSPDHDPGSPRAPPLTA